MTSSLLWTPSQDQINQSNLKAFTNYLKARYDLDIKDYKSLYKWSIDECETFWKSIWDFCGLIGSNQSEVILENGHNIEKAKFFPHATLNFAQNLLKRRDHKIAIDFFDEDKRRQTLTYNELYEAVLTLQSALKSFGVRPYDRIVGYLPNMPHTVIAMLATTSLGAIWSGCSPDFGIQSVLDRFGQISPKILFTVDGYFYNGKMFSCVDKVKEIAKKIPSLEKVIFIPYINESLESEKVWDDVIKESSYTDPFFEPFPFNHPLYILYSSGTTGVPKCIVHGAGGTLLQHLKEHQLHSDIKPNDKVFYFTTCSWMMWHWLVSSLASQASLILYDGSPTYPHPKRLFDIADETNMTLFGTSAKYIDALSKLVLSPIKTHKLLNLRLITSTGSPLSPESFDYVYQHIKKDVCLASISGGTDIISCFALGNPIGPVFKGELQTRGLGMAVDVFDDDGHSVRQTKGELVCKKPFPSQPLGFWNDHDGQKYHQAYFSRFPNIWHHGDFVELTQQDGLIIYGRSDTILNPGGVRIGTAEIYRQVEQIEEVLESIVVGYPIKGDEYVLLFVKLREGISLSVSLKERIKSIIRLNTTPRHVPFDIFQVSDIPRTKNGKIAELAVKNVLQKKEIKNIHSLANPEVLKEFENLFPEQDD